MSILNWWGLARSANPAAPNQPLEPKTVFLHVPKAAGTTLHHILLNAFPADSALTNVERDAYKDIDPAPYSFISGHFNFSYLKKHNLNAQVITILRDPIARSISHFYFLQQPFVLELVGKPTEGYDSDRISFTQKVINLARTLDLGTFLEKENRLARLVLGNYQTRQLGGVDSPEQPPTKDDLDTALINLRSCFHVGLSEKMNESVARLCKRMGWPIILPREPLNKTEKKVESKDQPPHILNLLKEINQYDLALYREGVEIYNERGEPDPGIPQNLPDAFAFTPAMPILGEGWHLREKSGARWMVWSGPANDSWLELSTKIQGPALLTCHLANVIHPSVISGFKMRVNETALALTMVKLEGRLAVRARVPQETLAATPGRVRLHFSIDRTWSVQEIEPSTPDKRKLGFALESIRLEKASRFM